MIPIQRLHHMAFRCRNSEETRSFYEDVIGLRLVHALEISETKTGRATRALHTFYEMADKSTVAFFEVPSMPFEFREQHDFDLHIALLTDNVGLRRALTIAQNRGCSVRGPSDHGFVTSHYLRDPNGYVVELCEIPRQAASVQTPAQAAITLKRWTREQTAAAE